MAKIIEDHTPCYRIEGGPAMSAGVSFTTETEARAHLAATAFRQFLWTSRIKYNETKDEKIMSLTNPMPGSDLARLEVEICSLVGQFQAELLELLQAPAPLEIKAGRKPTKRKRKA